MGSRTVTDGWHPTQPMAGVSRAPRECSAPALPPHSVVVDEATGERAYGSTPEEAEASARRRREHESSGAAPARHPWRVWQPGAFR